MDVGLLESSSISVIRVRNGSVVSVRMPRTECGTQPICVGKG